MKDLYGFIVIEDWSKVERILFLGYTDVLHQRVSNLGAR